MIGVQRSPHPLSPSTGSAGAWPTATASVPEPATWGSRHPPGTAPSCARSQDAADKSRDRRGWEGLSGLSEDYFPHTTGFPTAEKLVRAHTRPPGAHSVPRANAAQPRSVSPRPAGATSLEALLQGFSIPATGLICSSTCVPQNRPILSPRMAPPHLAASLPDSPRPPSARVAAPCSSDTPQSSWGQRLPSGSAQRPKVSFPRPPRSPLCGARATQGRAAVSARGSCGCCVFLSRHSDACQTHCVVLPSRLTARNGRRQGPSVRRASRVAQTPAGAARPPRQGLRPAGVVRGGAGSSPPPQRLF